MLETLWIEITSHGTAFALALIATAASHRLAGLWAGVFAQHCCRGREQC